MSLFVIAIVAIVLLLMMIKLRSNSGAMVSSARPTQDRRTRADRRSMKVRVPFERRRTHRRMEDEAAHFVNGLTNADSA